MSLYKRENLPICVVVARVESSKIVLTDIAINVLRILISCHVMRYGLTKHTESVL